jgi:hypothetical protein
MFDLNQFYLPLLSEKYMDFGETVGKTGSAGLLKKCLLLPLRGAIATKQSKKVRNNPPQAG